MTRISAVVLNWKDPKNTQECLANLANLGYLESVYLVNNEAETPVDLNDAIEIDECPIHQICLPENRGFSSGINVGAKAALQAGAEAVFFLNNDARINTTDFEKLISELAKPDVGVVAPKICSPQGVLQASGARLNTYNLAIDEKSKSDDIDFLTFACVLIDANTFHKIGFLDEAFFMYWEDVDFSLRVKAAGLSQRVVREAVATHEVSSSRKIAGSRLDLYSAFGLGVFGAKHTSFHSASQRRIALRIAKQVTTLNFSFAVKLFRAYMAGGKLTRPCYPDVTSVGWPSNKP